MAPTGSHQPRIGLQRPRASGQRFTGAALDQQPEGLPLVVPNRRQQQQQQREGESVLASTCQEAQRVQQAQNSEQQDGPTAGSTVRGAATLGAAWQGFQPQGRGLAPPQRGSTNWRLEEGGLYCAVQLADGVLNERATSLPKQVCTLLGVHVAEDERKTLSVYPPGSVSATGGLQPGAEAWALTVRRKGGSTIMTGVCGPMVQEGDGKAAAGSWLVIAALPSPPGALAAALFPPRSREATALLAADDRREQGVGGMRQGTKQGAKQPRGTLQKRKQHQRQEEVGEQQPQQSQQQASPQKRGHRPGSRVEGLGSVVPSGNATLQQAALRNPQNVPAAPATSPARQTQRQQVPQQQVPPVTAAQAAAPQAQGARPSAARPLAGGAAAADTHEAGRDAGKKKQTKKTGKRRREGQEDLLGGCGQEPRPQPAQGQPRVLDSGAPPAHPSPTPAEAREHLRVDPRRLEQLEQLAKHGAFASLMPPVQPAEAPDKGAAAEQAAAPADAAPAEAAPAAADGSKPGSKRRRGVHKSGSGVGKGKEQGLGGRQQAGDAAQLAGPRAAQGAHGSGSAPEQPAALVQRQPVGSSPALQPSALRAAAQQLVDEAVAGASFARLPQAPTPVSGPVHGAAPGGQAAAGTLRPRPPPQPTSQKGPLDGLAAATKRAFHTLAALTTQLAAAADGAPLPERRALAVVRAYLAAQQSAGKLPAEVAEATALLGLLLPGVPGQREPHDSQGTSKDERPRQATGMGGARAQAGDIEPSESGRSGGEAAGADAAPRGGASANDRSHRGAPPNTQAGNNPGQEGPQQPAAACAHGGQRPVSEAARDGKDKKAGSRQTHPLARACVAAEIDLEAPSDGKDADDDELQEVPTDEEEADIEESSKDSTDEEQQHAQQPQGDSDIEGSSSDADSDNDDGSEDSQSPPS